MTAPPYRNEGPPALWHVSEDRTIERFEPHHHPLHANDEPLVYAVDTRHLPLYWFPRDCPRACWWATDETSDDDVDEWLDGDRNRRVSVLESGWFDRMKTVRLYAYRMPDAAFEPWDKFFVSRETVTPLERIELGDLVARHVDARIELRIAPALYPLWDRVVATTLDFSGIRLRNATRA